MSGIKSYCIIKKMPIKRGKTQHVILVDSQGEIQEWTSLDIVEKLVEILNSNTDSGCEYVIKTI